MVVATGELVRINHVDDDMVQRRLGDRHDLMDSRRAEALSGAMVASMEDLARSVPRSLSRR
jgi:hypothetical protein